MATRKRTTKSVRKTTKRSLSKKQKIGVGAAVAGVAAAAAAGAYLFYGSKNAAKNRKVVKGWMNSAKKEVRAQVKRARKELSKGDYNKLVDQVMKKYKRLSSTSTAEANRLTRELKKEWAHLQRTAKKAVKTKKRSLQKVTKKKTTRKKTTRRKTTRRR